MSGEENNFTAGAESVIHLLPVSLSFLTPSAEPDELGWLAHYRVLKVLGEGGMGIVLLAEDTQLLRSVALKVIRPEIGQSDSNRQRFLNEARAMAQVKSDHVVTVHQVGQADDVCYMAMELLEGEPLDRWLDRTTITPTNEAVRIGREIALALAAAHARGLVHRDVKPANVWLEGPNRRVKLLDFGLARPQVGEGRLTNPGMIVGTPMYMAPEQAQGETLDGRTDLFSLGCVLYQMLTGRPPFGGQTCLAILTAVLTETPPQPSQFNPAIPSSLSDLLSRLIAKQPSARPDSAETVVVELQAIAATLSLLATLPAGYAVSPPNQGRGEINSPQAVGTPPPSALESFRPHVPGALESSPAQRRLREAERRQVTVLTCGCNLFESEEYLVLDAEDQVKVMRAFREACELANRRLDGTIVQCDERGLLACFGYPVAHEDAARRAARVALGLLEDLESIDAQLLRDHKMVLTPWVGLHTGVAVVEEKEGTVSLTGEARNVAVRLGGVAVPGKIICTETTHRLVRGHFDCVSLGLKKIKGVTQPVALFRVEGTAGAVSLLEVSAAIGLSPLVGRDLEVGLLKDRWEQATEGRGQVVFLVADPGLGKSRLVHTLKEHILGQMVEGELDSPVIEWRCAPHFQNTGLHPAIDFYERALGFRPEEPPQERFNRLLSRVEKYDLARPDIVPLWASLLSLPTPDRFPPLSLSPARQREETFRLMLEWLHVRSARHPVVLVVEDLHWADASTLEFLGLYLMGGLEDHILMVLTYRPEFQPPWPTAAHQTTLSLNRLTKRQTTDLMRRKMGTAVSDAIIDQFYDRTDGVPLYVEEFARVVQESSGPGRTGEGESSTSILRGREIPATLQDLMAARLDGMDGGRDVAQLGAILGREFTHELLAEVMDLDDATLQAELAKLVRAEILSQKGRPPRCTYTFKHALLEDSLYNALTKGKRQLLHHRVAKTLETWFPQTVETRPELLAHHFTEAGLIEEAITYWIKAGLRSRDRAAEREAICHLTKSLALLETLGESRNRDEQKLKVLTTLGPAYIAARGYAAPEVGPVLLRAGELCQGFGDETQQFGIMLGRWEWSLVRGDLRTCVDLAADGMALAERLDKPGMLMEALFMLGATMFYRARFAEAHACFVKALSSNEDPERTRYWTAYTGHNASVTQRCYLALTLWHLGYPDQALKVCRESCELARTIGHAFSLGHALDFAAFLHHYCRLGVEVQTAAEEELAIGAEQGFQLWHALGILHNGAGLLLQGRRDESLPILLKGFGAFQATGAEVRIPSYLSILGDAYTQCERFADSHKVLDEGLVTAEKNDDRSHEAELHRLKGELLLAESADQMGAAEDCFLRAIETARHQKSRAWELRATMNLARLWSRQHQREKARVALTTVYDLYTEGFKTPDLEEARSLLQHLA